MKPGDLPSRIDRSTQQLSMADQHFLSSQGFTLIEIAIVLVIVGLLVGMGAAMIGPLSNMSKIRETKDLLDADSQAITSWASSNNRVPDTASFISVAKTPTDSWGRPIVYLYDTNLTLPTKDTICGRRSTLLTVTTTAPAATIPNVAFVLLSGGGNSIGPSPQSTLAGFLSGAAFNGVVTASAPVTGISTLTQDAAVGDIVRWVTLDELRSKVGCQGAPLKIVNNELPYGAVGAPYPSTTANAMLTISVDGGATPGVFRWCIEATSATALPSGLSFTGTAPPAAPVAAPGVPVQVTTANSCNGVNNPLPKASWFSSANLSIFGTPLTASQGSYGFTVYVRDNSDATGSNDNIASKPFVLTINPQ